MELKNVANVVVGKMWNENTENTSLLRCVSEKYFVLTNVHQVFFLVFFKLYTSFSRNKYFIIIIITLL